MSTNFWYKLDSEDIVISAGEKPLNLSQRDDPESESVLRGSKGVVHHILEIIEFTDNPWLQKNLQNYSDAQVHPIYNNLPTQDRWVRLTRNSHSSRPYDEQRDMKLVNIQPLHSKDLHSQVSSYQEKESKSVNNGVWTLSIAFVDGQGWLYGQPMVYFVDVNTKVEQLTEFISQKIYTKLDKKGSGRMSNKLPKIIIK